MGKKNIEVNLTVKYVPLPPEKEFAWWAAMRWIVKKLHEIREEKKSDE